MNSSAIGQDLSAATAALVARQPIFDTELRVLAHELLYRGAVGDHFASIGDPRTATLQVLMNACLEIGLNYVTGDKPAYVNFPRELLTGDAPLPLPLPPERIVIEVLEDVPADQDVMDGLAALRRRGHKVALDDFSFEHSDAALLAAADVVKVDVMALDPDQLARTCEALRPRNVLLIAEKIETLEQLDHCRLLGFRGFQGFFLRRPETFKGRRIPTNRLAALRIMAELQNPLTSAGDLEPLVGRDAATSYRILQCINSSSFYNLSRPVKSLREAIVILGIDQLRRLCALVMLAGFDDRPGQLLVDAMVRARMCELLAQHAGITDSGSYFVTGLFSVIDALVAQPLEEAIARLPLAMPIIQALLQDEGDMGAALACVRNYERGDWNGVTYGGLDTGQIRSAYLQALRWAEEGRELVGV